MNREIKFRGKSELGWHYGDLTQWDGHCTIFNRKNGQDYNVRPETVGEITGLYDKNGKDIYEGDILSVIEVREYGMKEHISVVEYEDAAFLVSLDQEKDTYLGACCNSAENSNFLSECEVIGNISDNPELIKI